MGHLGGVRYSFLDGDALPEDVRSVVDIRIANDDAVFVGAGVGLSSFYWIVKLDSTGNLDPVFGDATNDSLGLSGDGFARMFLCYGALGMELDQVTGDVWMPAWADGDCSGTHLATLDDTDGAVLAGFGPNAAPTPDVLWNEFGGDIAPHPDGGMIFYSPLSGHVIWVDEAFEVVTDFGTDGVVDFAALANPYPFPPVEVHVADDGVISVAYSAISDDLVSCDDVGCTYGPYDIVVGKVASSGIPVGTFGGGDGIAEIDTNITYSTIYGSPPDVSVDVDLAVDDAGRMIVSHYSGTEADRSAVTVVLPDGSIDTGWGAVGTLLPGVWVDGLAVTADAVVTVGNNVSGELAAWTAPDGVAPAPPLCATQSATIYGTAGADVLNGTAGADVIVGSGGNDTINGFGGGDVICAGAGDDFVAGGGGNDTIYAGAGADQIYGSYGNDNLFGGSGDDFINAGPGNDFVSGNEGADTIYGKDNADHLEGGPHADTLHAGNGSDFVAGGGGNDLVIGGGGPDSIYGGYGSDNLQGWGGDDSLFGGPANDTLNGGAGNDTCNGGAGTNALINC